jgi:hypothetical protein
MCLLVQFWLKVRGRNGPKRGTLYANKLREGGIKQTLKENGV